MKDLVVIIPLHEFSKEIEEQLTGAIKSVPDSIDIIISCSHKIESDIKKISKKHKNVSCLASYPDAPTDFCSLVEYGVQNSDSKWFSILEYDDEYTSIWFDNFKKYADFYPDISVFIPLEDLVDAADNKFIGIGNEAPWASSFSNEIGYIDLDCLQNFFDFYMTGSIFNTEDWKEVGGLKPPIKLTFWYEWLLRATYKGKKVFVIPKVGYTHLLGRKGSLIESYKDTIDDKESNFWVNVARKDYFYKEIRDSSKYLYDANKKAEEDE